MKHIAIVRKNGQGFNIPTREDFNFHFYPFEDLIIRSHIHPRYAIYEAGRKLVHKAPKADANAFDQVHPELANKIRVIYGQWCQPVPEKAEGDTRFRPRTPQPSEDGHYQNNAQHTPQHRIPPPAFRIPNPAQLWPDLLDSYVAKYLKEPDDSDSDYEPKGVDRTNTEEDVTSDAYSASNQLTAEALHQHKNAQQKHEWDKDGVTEWFCDQEPEPDTERRRT
jgi:hypothetical protein